MLPCKFQAQIVCYCVQAGSPAGFFAAFFPGKKARILPVQFRFFHLPEAEKTNACQLSFRIFRAKHTQASASSPAA